MKAAREESRMAGKEFRAFRKRWRKQKLLCRQSG